MENLPTTVVYFGLFIFKVSVMRSAVVECTNCDQKVPFSSLRRGTEWTMGLRSAVGYVSDCRCRGRKFDPGPNPHFRK